jgi:hypothetical protein
MSILGRFLSVIMLALIGLVAGLAFGAYRAFQDVAALPPLPEKATMGMESSGFIPFIVGGIDLALGAVVGAILGLLVGIVLALLWPRSRAS